MDLPAAGQGAYLHVLAREDGQNAICGLGCGAVDRGALGMRMRAAQDIGVGLTRTIYIVRVITFACQKSEVLDALYGGAYARTRGSVRHSILPFRMAVFPPVFWSVLCVIFKPAPLAARP